MYTACMGLVHAREVAAGGVVHFPSVEEMMLVAIMSRAAQRQTGARVASWLDFFLVDEG